MNISTNELLKSWQKGSSKWTKASSLGADCEIIHLFLLLMPVCLPEEGRAVPLPAHRSWALPLTGAWAFPQNAQRPEATGMGPDRVLTYVGINRAGNSPRAASQQLSHAFRGRSGSSKPYWVFLQLLTEAQARCFSVQVWLSLTLETQRPSSSTYHKHFGG